LSETDPVAGKRARAWQRLTPEEQARVPALLESCRKATDIPPFPVARSSFEKVLYGLAAAGQPVTPAELAYLLISCWGYNSDVASIRRRIALAVQQEVARSTGGDLYRATDLGFERLTGVAPFRPDHGRPGPAVDRFPRSGGLRRGPPAIKPWRRDDPSR